MIANRAPYCSGTFGPGTCGRPPSPQAGTASSWASRRNRSGEMVRPSFLDTSTLPDRPHSRCRLLRSTSAAVAVRAIFSIGPDACAPIPVILKYVMIPSRCLSSRQGRMWWWHRLCHATSIALGQFASRPDANRSSFFYELGFTARSGRHASGPGCNLLWSLAIQAGTDLPRHALARWSMARPSPGTQIAWARRLTRADRLNGTTASTAPPSSRTCIAHPAQHRPPPILG